MYVKNGRFPTRDNSPNHTPQIDPTSTLHYNKTMTHYTRTRIYSTMTGSAFLHVEDALDLTNRKGEPTPKIRIFAGSYGRNQGTRKSTAHFLDLADARVIFSNLANGRNFTYKDHKGSATKQPPVANTLKVNKSKAGDYYIELERGRGEAVGQGAVKPTWHRGGAEISINVKFSEWDAQTLGHAVYAYLLAWECSRMLQSSRTYPPYPTSDIDNDNGIENGRFYPSPLPNNTQPDPLNLNGQPAAKPGHDYTYANGTAVPDHQGSKWAFDCYIRTHKAKPRDPEMLSAWWKQNAKNHPVRSGK